MLYIECKAGDPRLLRVMSKAGEACKTGEAGKAGEAADLCHVWYLYARALTQAHESGAHHTAHLWQARRSHASLQDRRWEWYHLLLVYLHLCSVKSHGGRH